jgi:hypothetical protein
VAGRDDTNRPLRQGPQAFFYVTVRPGTDVMIFLNILFSPKHLAKKLAFLTRNKAKI